MLPICKHNVINKERVKNSSALNLLRNFRDRRQVPVGLICLQIMERIQGAHASLHIYFGLSCPSTIIDLRENPSFI